jgi:hypothetical protein
LIVRRARSPFVVALADLSEALAALGVDWYLFGAQAALIYGAARVTADVDVTVRLGKVTPARLATALKRNGFMLRVDDAAFVRTTRVLPVLHSGTSVPADLVLAGPGLEDGFLERAVIHDLGGLSVPVACAEDLIIMKILAGREKDLDDVAAILAARGPKLDTHTISSALKMVEEALGQSDLVSVWEGLRARLVEPATPKHSSRTTADSRGVDRATPPARGRKGRRSKKI